MLSAAVGGQHHHWHFETLLAKSQQDSPMAAFSTHLENPGPRLYAGTSSQASFSALGLTRSFHPSGSLLGIKTYDIGKVAPWKQLPHCPSSAKGYS